MPIRSDLPLDHEARASRAIDGIARGTAADSEVARSARGAPGTSHETKGWNPRPPRLGRADYFAGYSDGFHYYVFGAGHDHPSQTYRAGYSDGERDRAAIAAAPQPARTKGE